ncbi:unnamed protein product [Dicrocoelium dendriticum]|nr:unnamed protein product [Dicrocoelium dendriticum]
MLFSNYVILQNNSHVFQQKVRRNQPNKCRELKRFFVELCLFYSHITKALLDKNNDVAKVYAENAIRKHNESVNYLRLASRLDAVQSRIQSAIQMNQAVKNIGSVSKELEKAMKSMNLEQIEKIMGKFESQFEDLDVRSFTMENSMGNAVTLSAPEDQVNSLLQKVAAESGLEIDTALRGVDVPSGSLATEQSKSVDEDALTQRLAALRE